MLAYLWVGFGSALGGMARYWCSGFFGALIGETFPYGTMIVNVSGAILIGVLASLSDPDGRLLIGTSGRQFLMTGICGGYTTFSTFSLETLSLARDGEWTKASGNALFSVLLCMLAVWLGFSAGSYLSRLRG